MRRTAIRHDFGQKPSYLRANFQQDARGPALDLEHQLVGDDGGWVVKKQADMIG